MKTRIIVAISAAAFLFAAVAIRPAFAAPGAAAVSQITGSVEVRSSGADWRTAKVNDLLSAGDTVRTGASSRAKLILPGGAAVVVGALTVFNVKEIDPGFTGSSAAGFSVDKGEIRSTVPKGNTKTTFTVTTPTAVAGVRGTDFAVEVAEEDETTLVTVFEGAVEVGGLLDELKEKILVEKDHESEIRRGAAPTIPRLVDKERLRKKLQRLSRNRGKEQPDGDEETGDLKARAIAVAAAAGIGPDEREKIAGKIAEAGLDPAQVEKVIAAGVRNGNVDLAGRVLDAVAEKGVPPAARDKLASLIEKNASQADVESRLSSLVKDNAARAKIQAVRKQIVDSMDKGKADDALAKLGPDSPQRKELMLIREAIEKGIPRERIELLLGALDKGLLDAREARILIQALSKNIDARDIMGALEQLHKMKADQNLRALVFKAVNSGVDLRAVFEKLKESGLTLEQIKQRLAEIIKAKLAAQQQTQPKPAQKK